MSTKETMATIDATVARVLGRHGLTDTATIQGKTITGYYRRAFVEDGAGEQGVPGARNVFDCRAEDVPEGLLPDVDEVTIEGEGTFRYQRSEPHGSGRVLLVLGEIL